MTTTKTILNATDAAILRNQLLRSAALKREAQREWLVSLNAPAAPKFNGNPWVRDLAPAAPAPKRQVEHWSEVKVGFTVQVRSLTTDGSVEWTETFNRPTRARAVRAARRWMKMFLDASDFADQDRSTVCAGVLHIDLP